MKRWFGIATFIAILACAGTPAQADETGLYATPAAGSVISDVRFGIYAHDMYPHWIPWDVGDYTFDQIEDVNFEVLFRLPDVDAVRWLGAPKVNLGATVNLDGQESLAHLALTWQVPVADTPVFVEASIGGAIHNGILTGTFGGRGTLRPQGCRIGFYTSAGLGVNFNENVYGMLAYEHMSNADLCSPNFGVSNMGLKLGIRFE